VYLIFDFPRRTINTPQQNDEEINHARCTLLALLAIFGEHNKRQATCSNRKYLYMSSDKHFFITIDPQYNKKK